MDEMTNPDEEVIDQAAGAADDGQAGDSFDSGEVENNADDGEGQTGEEGAEGAEVDTEEVEIDGKRYAVPKELKDKILMHGDYTRKTQEVAEQRRVLEQEAQEFGHRQERIMSHMQEHAQLIAISEQLAQYDQINWQALNQEDPQQAQALFFQRQQLQEAQQQLGARLSQAEQQFALEKQQETAKRIEQGRAVLAKEIPGWNPEMAGKVRSFGVQVFGSEEAMSKSLDLADPRNIKMLHLARIGFEAQQKATQKPKPAPAKPVTKVSSGSNAVQKPPEKMTDAEWYRWRQSQKKS
ncbi:hypothetical protein ACG97_05940 [Vogesella sp. EB]|uniref:hypothetical protein n=1 Tax=Vogesella sp. EB TaxID=1526735 RepID=UPI00064D0B84|nr:hypothetical protein [Vogesella sp. EB]KMJ53786.1 hypothetical protein ACG97_05940 [Vogesella sp. EB]